jgi:hypothetical protein
LWISRIERSTLDLCPLTPALSPKGARGKGADLFSRPEFGSVFQVGVLRINNAVSPLSLRERARVRGF